MTKKKGEYAFAFVLVCVLVDMIGFGLIMPVMPDLLTELTGQPASEVVAWAGLLGALYALVNFFANPIIGGLSDRFGRRPVLILSISMLGVDFLIMGLADSVWLLFLGRFLSGISSATFSTANAYIADVTDADKRGRAFGMIGAAFGLGFIIGPVMGGLLGQLGPRAPFFAAAAIACLNSIYGIFVLPESLPLSKRRAFNLARANPFGALKHFSRLPHIGFLLLACGLFGLAHFVYPAIWSFHAEIRYDWTSRDIGLSLGFLGLVSVIVQGGLVGPAIKKLGEANAAVVGLIVNAVAMFGFASASAGWMMYPWIVISGFGGLAGPSINLIMSTRTPADAQGELQGAASSIQSLAAIISPLMMTQILFFFSSARAPVYFPGAAFFAAGLLVLLALVPLYMGFRAASPLVADKPPV